MINEMNGRNISIQGIHDSHGHKTNSLDYIRVKAETNAFITCSLITAIS